MARITRTHLGAGKGVGDGRGNVVDLTPRHLKREDFGKRLYRLMMSKSWSQAELGRASGIQRASISAYINGRNYPDPQNLAKLASALGVPVENLLPNQAEGAIDRDNGGPYMKISSADPSKAWLRIDQLVDTHDAVDIISILTRKKIDAPDRE